MNLFAVILLASGLYEQAVSRLLAERFPAVEYLLIEAPSGRVVTSNWPDVSAPNPAGSLTKPFLAGADAEFVCEPGACWLPQGHGRLRIAGAIAHSCNAWFLNYEADAPLTLPPPPNRDPATLIGLRSDWLIPPLTLARAYIGLAGRSEAVRRGMLEAALNGTARRLGVQALAKTGTAACSHPKRGAGDGLVVALWPAADPKYVLMVRVHGTTGAMAAEAAGALLRTVRDGR